MADTPDVIPVSSSERRAQRRVPTGFFAVELRGASRYFRLVRDVSRTGLRIENRLADARPGQIIELEIPRGARSAMVRVRGEVIYVTDSGQVGVRLLDGADLFARDEQVD